MDVSSTIFWVNGELVPAERATASARDHGLVVGDGVFEAVKVVRGQTFALRRHLERMARSAAGMGLPGYDADRVRAAAAEVIAANRELLVTDYDLLRITFTAGPGVLGSGRIAADATTPTLILGLTPGHDPDPQVGVITVPYRRNEVGALTGLKTTSYGENVLALSQAHAAGAGEAVFANTRGELCEGTGTNVFVVRDGELLTPPLSSGCLAGVTRALVLEWVGAREVDLPYDALTDSDEVFLTSSARDIQPVVAVDGRPVGDGTPGPVTRAAQQAFAVGQARSLEP
ncbi:aminotransferase class IV [Cellulomonas denverensis]|uniref:4-amino-4-deoxychorismate lyase n=1 Tax=Cellulomonas denverensis TaxID=264297 RepID=A0A7X6QYD4_9CELL|nr:aminotransferase class IV [Cellulomonas denverensis]NKY21998.1 4-amino-4-deoxychorismate lyase [Cellulomonas denverensis]GIG24109.1 4-amino-4-deoxychorismate lyase [Cellulomonas denverensis]